MALAKASVQRVAPSGTAPKSATQTLVSCICGSAARAMSSGRLSYQPPDGRTARTADIIKVIMLILYSLGRRSLPAGQLCAFAILKEASPLMSSTLAPTSTL